MDKLELEKEKDKLKSILEIISEILEKNELELNELYDNFYVEREELWRIADSKKLHIKNLESSLERPYFARIDFTDENGLKNIYIGKNGVLKDTNVVVTDWRAPISSLYYDAELGKCSYKAPEGIIDGILSLKRQYEIENGELKEYFDVDLVSNDALLQKYLNSNNDSRLKSIVSTIQKEQNNVIRKEILDNLIVQGVAGSGKTTVALHRIAYLVYNYIKGIRQNQYLVIGPNPVFLKYIKSVLPELDVDGVEQCTYETYASKYINEDIKVNSSDKKVIANILGKNSLDVEKFKCSMKYKDMLDKFMETYFYSITSKPLMLGDFEVIPKEVIQRMFQNTSTGSYKSLNSRIGAIIELLCNYVENKTGEITEKYSNYSYEFYKNATTEEEKNNLKMKFLKDKNEIDRHCRNIIRNYFNKIKNNTTKLYKLFISTVEDYNIHNYKNIKQLKKDTLNNIKNNTYDYEDLAALIYIKSIISPNEEYEKMKHVVIDEAQDLGEFNFFSLRKTLPEATFSIFGDLAQSIYDYRGINNWEEVNNIMFNNTGKIINFNKSYRTTAEIMDIADDVSESIDLGRSDLVVRHGNEVELTEIENNTDIPSYVAKKIQEYKDKGYKTIAVISKTNLLSCYMNDDLQDLGIYIPNVSPNDDLTDSKFRICTISNQLAKGLEFDAVIINNANEKIYSSNNKLDMKLLYVAITRALHELDIVYSGEITKPLEKHLNKVKNLQLVKTK